MSLGGYLIRPGYRWVAPTALVLLIASCGGGDLTDLGQSGSQTTYGQFDSQISGLGVTLDVPAGWSSRNSGVDGLQVARQSEDLGTRPPGGPRLTVTPGNTVLPEPLAVIDALATPVEVGTELIEEPQTVFVGSTEGVSIGLSEHDGGTVVARRYVIVNTGGANVLQFLLEAPEEQWAEDVTELEGILRNVTYEPRETARPPSTLSPTTSAADGAVTPTTGTLQTIRGNGSADDPYQLPYYETFSAPVDDRWIIRDSSDPWTWDVVAEELATTAHNSEMLLRAPWTPEFDLPRAGALEIQIDATQPTAGTSCGLALYFRDTPYSGGIGLLVDSSEQRVLLWAPISGKSPEESQWVANSSISQGAINHIRMSINSLASAETDELSVYANGQVVTTLAAGWSETLGPPFGFSPLAMVEPGVAGGECRFDNFFVTQSTP